jgi:hypothetical protein
MKTKIFMALTTMAIAILASGCITTVSGTKTAGDPFGRDSLTGRYQRSEDQVYRAAIQVINNDGKLLTEYIPHNSTNVVRAFKGRVNQNDVWVRVEAVELQPPLTQITVEARTKWGNQDLNLAHELEKEVALQLARQTAF